MTWSDEEMRDCLQLNSVIVSGVPVSASVLFRRLGSHCESSTLHRSDTLLLM